MTNSAEPVLLVEKADGIAVLTLNRPDSMNALSHELRGALAHELEALRSDEETEVVILTGAGRAFCAGLDLKELANPVPRGPEAHGEASVQLKLPDLIRNLPQPVIGAVNGVAITGGFEIATSCDFLIGTPDTRFSDTHARVGILPGWGLSQRLPRIIGINRAKELSLTGNYLFADKACEWGLLNRIVELAELMPTCLELARNIQSCDPMTMRKYKQLLDDGFDLPLGEAMALEARVGRAHERPSHEELEKRRLKVMDRGRKQSKKQ
jgi:enoyl-CoA hydratase